MQTKYAANLRFWERHRVVFIRGLRLVLAELSQLTRPILGLCEECVGPGAAPQVWPLWP